jgi:hypothetical protein
LSFSSAIGSHQGRNIFHTGAGRFSHNLLPLNFWRSSSSPTTFCSFLDPVSKFQAPFFIFSFLLSRGRIQKRNISYSLTKQKNAIDEFNLT